MEGAVLTLERRFFKIGTNGSSLTVRRGAANEGNANANEGNFR